MLGKTEEASLAFRRSLYIVKDAKAGEILSRENLRPIRPGFGLKPKHFETLLGRQLVQDAEAGTPMSWDLVGGE